MTIRGILFDKDGTLIDVNGTWVPIYRQLLCEQFAIDTAQADALMQRVGYNPNTEGFFANSILASGTTRQLVENWWPDLDEADDAVFDNTRMLHGRTAFTGKRRMAGGYSMHRFLLSEPDANPSL